MPGGDALTTSLLLPLRVPSALTAVGVPPPRGVLLHGGAGSGKTTLARHIAQAADANFVEVHAAQLVAPTLGASEANLAKLFASARSAAPCILFLDGLEALGATRGNDATSEGTMDRLLSLLLLELDAALRTDLTDLTDPQPHRTGLTDPQPHQPDTPHAPPLVVLAATSDRDALDPALLRAGRLDVHILIPPPDTHQRTALLRHMLHRTPVAWEEGGGEAATLCWLATLCDGYTLAQLSAVCREAAMASLREDVHAPSVRIAHLEAAVRVVARGG